MTQERGNQNTIYYLFKKSPNEFTQNAAIECFIETRLLEGDGEEPGKETTKKLHMRNHSGIGLLLIFMQKKQIESTLL